MSDMCGELYMYAYDLYFKGLPLSLFTKRNECIMSW